MQHYVPMFILQECEEKRYAGSITAFALFLDIADFTEISNKFLRSGSKGAEALSNYLAAAFAYPIIQVESQGGFISHFAGDAFCAIFPGSDCRAIRQALSNIQDHFTDKVYHDPELGEFPISIRLTLTYGEVEWKILRNKVQHEYVFSGSPLQEIYSLSSHKEVCMLSQAVQKAFAAAPKEILEVVPSSYDFSETTRQLFTKAKLADLEVENEIRDAAYCFVDLSRIEDSSLEGVLESIHTKLEDYSGFLNKIDATDKGLVALVLFGLPKAIGNTLERMCRFALEMIIEEPKLSMGLACGSAYAGYVGCADTREFTALGSTVNLASRLMQKAGVGEIVTDSYLQQEMHYKYHFAASEPVKLKGFAAEVHSHNLLGRLPRPPQSFHTDFVGREAEIESLRQVAKEPGSRIIYISGEPGMGKSRLIIEALKPFPHSYFLFSDPSVHRLLEPIKQLVGQYFAIDPLLSKQRRRELFRKQWQELAQDDKELIRIESLIGQLLGYEWERSVWSVLPPEEKPEQLKNAFVSFVSRIAQGEKLIIHLDDPQWLDDSTLEYFRLLGEKKVEGVTVFAACRYLDDGSAVDLEIPNWESKHVDLVLLTPETAAVMIKQILGVESIPEDSLDWIVRKADGNPLFLEQVVAYLKENNCFDAEHKLVGNLNYLSSFGIADIIGSRIDSLTENVRNTLQHACVLGLEFNTRVLCEMLSRKLDEDLGKGKHAKVWADLDELRYIFTHVLIKDTAYNRMLSDKLKGLHLLAAEVMVKLYNDDEKVLNEHAEGIAEHYANAGEQVKAAVYYLRAGSCYRNSFNWVRSEGCFKIALGIREKVLGAEHPDTAFSLINLADLYREQAKYRETEELYLQALDILDKHLGSNHSDLADLLNKLGLLYDVQRQFPEAETLFLKALAIMEETVGADHLDTAMTLSNLAGIYMDQDNYSKAEQLYLRAIAIFQKALNGKHPKTAGVLGNLAILYGQQGRYAEAEPLYQKSLTLVQQENGEDHPATARTLNNLGIFYAVQGLYDKAEPLFIKTLSIKERVLGSKHPDTALSLKNIALLYKDQHKYAEAEQMCLKALAIREKVLGKEHPATATTMNGLADIYIDQGKFKEAETIYLRTLAIYEKTLGKEKSWTAITMYNLGAVYKNQGMYDESKSYYISSFEIFKTIFGIEHPRSQQAITKLISVCEELNLLDEAAEYKAMLIATEE
jgi:tetratricopeptide (TPR) repeat protein/class 3 adenylate cyclase